MLEERNEGRVFVRARKHYRPRYSRTEVAIGAGVVGILALIAGWIAVKGAHPDPELMRSVTLERRGSPAAERGAIPANIAPPNWREATLSSFDPTNLYV